MAVTGRITEQAADNRPRPLGRLTEQTAAWGNAGSTAVGRITQQAAYLGGGSTATGRITEMSATATIVPGRPGAMTAAQGEAWIPCYLYTSDESGKWQ